MNIFCNKSHDKEEDSRPGATNFLEVISKRRKLCFIKKKKVLHNNIKSLMEEVFLSKRAYKPEFLRFAVSKL